MFLATSVCAGLRGTRPHLKSLDNVVEPVASLGPTTQRGCPEAGRRVGTGEPNEDEGKLGSSRHGRRLGAESAGILRSPRGRGGEEESSPD